MDPARWFRLWFGVHAPVDARTYAVHGFGLTTFKYVVDALIVAVLTGHLWTPVDYLNPIWGLRAQKLEEVPASVLLLMSAWALPFMWIGASMSIRRAADAGRSPWLGLLFFVPLVNYVFMLTMCLAPTRTGRRMDVPGPTAPAGVAAVTLAVLTPAIAAPLALGVSVFVFQRYGGFLFMGSPFLIGVLSGFILNRGHQHSVTATMAAATLAVLATGGWILLFALEGIICLAMALPLALPSALLGAVCGRVLAGQPPARWSHAVVAVVTLPFLAGFEAPPTPVHEVMTAVEVDAPPDAVWPHVVAFSELAPPTEWWFVRGIAYPMRARIEGTGVGAVRYCEFSTGPFVEPITAWEAPHRLAFDVRAQPPAMHEWSPWPEVNAPHLDGYLRSRRGEFRLVPLPGGRTRLEGRTWYEVDIFPQVYWRIWSDALIHSIHERVLAHVARLATS